MELSELRIFRAVVREGGVTRAADRLRRVQSDVTTRVRQLEEKLGTSLFIREGKRLHLAPAGQVLLGYADRLLALADEASAAVPDPRPRGTFRLGAMESTAAVRLPEPLTQFHHLYPEVVIELRTGNPEILAKAILAGELDAALVAEPVADGPFEKMVVFIEEPVIVSAPSSLDQKRGRLPAVHSCIRERVPAPQAIGGLVREARSDARAHCRTWVVSRDARLCAGRDGHCSAAGERAGNFPEVQATEDPSPAPGREPV